MTLTVAQIRIEVSGDAAGAVSSLNQTAEAEERVTRAARSASGTHNELSTSFVRVGTSAKDIAVGVLAGAAGFSLLAAGGVAAGRLIEQTVSGIAASVIGMNASLETSTLQFKILMGNADQATAHVQGLFAFAKESPFETGPIIEASRQLYVMGGAALDTDANLRLVADAAAGASAPIQEVARWVGRAYSEIQGGRPFGEAAQRLQELGLISGDARNKLEGLQQMGAQAPVVWAAFTQELGRFSGSSKELQSTWTGLTSTFSDSTKLLTSEAFKPFFDVLKAGISDLNTFLDSDAVKKWATDTAAGVKEAIGTIGEIKQDITVGLNVAGIVISSDLDIGKLVQSWLQQQVSDVGKTEIDVGPFVTLADTQKPREALVGGIQLLFEAMKNTVSQEWKDLGEVPGIKDAIEHMRVTEAQAIDSTFTPEQRRAWAAQLFPSPADIQAAADTSAAAIPDALATINSAWDRAQHQFDVGDKGKQLTQAIRQGIKTPELQQVALEQALAFGESWRKGLDPLSGEAERRMTELHRLVTKAFESGSDEDVAAVGDFLARFNVGDRVADQNHRVAQAIEAQNREKEAAVREAKRIAEEWRRTMPITAENFGSFLGPATESAAMGSGKAVFDALTKAIHSGGEDAIKAAAEASAGIRQKMLDATLFDDAASWAEGFTEVVQRAVEEKTPQAIAAVGEYVKAFDIAQQLDEAGRHAAEAINTATDKTSQAIQDAHTQTQAQIDRIREDFDFSQSVARDMEKLQDAVKTGMAAARRNLEDGERELRLSRDAEDRARQIGREDSSAATSRARQDRDVAIASAHSREDLEREHQRRIADIQRQNGPGAGAALTQEQRQYQDQLEALARNESRAREDRQRQRADQEQDRQRTRALAEQDRQIRDARAASDRERQRTNEAMLETLQKQLEAPIKQLQLGVQIHGMERQIADLRTREREEVEKLNAALQETIDKEHEREALTARRLGVQPPGAASESIPVGAPAFFPGFFPTGPIPSPQQGGSDHQVTTEDLADLMSEWPQEITVNLDGEDITDNINAHNVREKRWKAIS